MTGLEATIQEVQKYAPMQKYCGVRFTGKTAQKVAGVVSQEATYYVGGNDTIYSFKHDIDLQIGDTVVCDCTTGLAVGYVTTLTGGNTVDKPISTRWIVQRVDMGIHKARLEKDTVKKEIRRKMDDRRKQLEDEALYRMMAERDPEMAKLIEQYYEV
jgi:hypothetical protein